MKDACTEVASLVTKRVMENNREFIAPSELAGNRRCH